MSHHSTKWIEIRIQLERKRNTYFLSSFRLWKEKGNGRHLYIVSQDRSVDFFFVRKLNLDWIRVSPTFVYLSVIVSFKILQLLYLCGIKTFWMINLIYHFVMVNRIVNTIKAHVPANIKLTHYSVLNITRHINVSISSHCFYSILFVYSLKG